jgi:hypothetical protein
MMKWQPIESAPKDGTEILGWDKEGKYASVSFKVTRYYCNWENKYRDSKSWWKGNVTCTPTHWMPLPKPPETKE